MDKLEITKLGLTAPNSFFETDSATLAMMAGGCGPGKIGDWLVPDTVYGLSIKAACFIHDYMYAIGTTSQEKETADQIFLNNMLLIIGKETTTLPFIGRHLRSLRRWRAMTYYNAVVEGGEKHFKKITIN